VGAPAGLGRAAASRSATWTATAAPTSSRSSRADPGRPQRRGQHVTPVTVRTSGSYNDVKLADVDLDGWLDLVTLRSRPPRRSRSTRTTGRAASPRRPRQHDLREARVPLPVVARGRGRGRGRRARRGLTSVEGTGDAVVYRGLGNGAFAPVATEAGTIWDETAGCFARTWSRSPTSTATAATTSSSWTPTPTRVPRADVPSTNGTDDAHPARSTSSRGVALGEQGRAGPWRSVHVGGNNARLDGDNLGVASTTTTATEQGPRGLRRFPRHHGEGPSRS